MKFLLLFLDGVGLGPDDPKINPLARARMPHLETLLGGEKLVSHGQLETGRATLKALDACLGVDGLPQSATGQAALLTGQNVPAIVGYHHGPRPNSDIARFLKGGSLLTTLVNRGCRVAFVNAFPPQYFETTSSGPRARGTIAQAVLGAGIPLKTVDDLLNGEALSADFTGSAWRDRLGFTDIPLLEPHEAGERLATLAQRNDFTLFEFWLSDYIGHRRNMETASTMLATVDQVLGGLLDAWDEDRGLILITSDHGNLEDLSTRRHTTNSVPGLIIGPPHYRYPFSASLRNLTHIAPAIARLFEPGSG
ncbi:MAG: alkaline phosphatase family protein [Candidatus Neomarinimicrobiota bacterium]